jgi:prophage regulatory protein
MNELRSTGAHRARVAHMQPKLLRRVDVEALTGLSRTSLYRFMLNGAFPRPVRLGSRAVAWRAEDVSAWIRGLREAA